MDLGELINFMSFTVKKRNRYQGLVNETLNDGSVNIVKLLRLTDIRAIYTQKCIFNYMKEVDLCTFPRQKKYSSLFRNNFHLKYISKIYIKEKNITK